MSSPSCLRPNNLSLYDHRQKSFQLTDRLRIEYSQAQSPLLMEIQQRRESVVIGRPDSMLNSQDPLIQAQPIHSLTLKVNFCYRAIFLQRSEFMAMVQPKQKLFKFLTDAKNRLTCSGERRCAYLETHRQEFQHLDAQDIPKYIFILEAFNDGCHPLRNDIGLVSWREDMQPIYLIGVQHISQTTQRDILKRLNHQLRFSQAAIQDQVHYSLNHLLYQCYVDLQRMAVLPHININMVFHEYLLRHPLPPSLDTIQQMVYHHIAHQGLFGLNLELSSLDQPILLVHLMDCVAGNSKIPWGSKYHLSFQMGCVYYSFNEFNQVNTTDVYYRSQGKKELYQSLKVFDFFPLDQWITCLSQALYDNWADIQTRCLEWRKYYAHINGHQVDSLDQDMLRGFGMLPPEDRDHAPIDLNNHNFNIDGYQYSHKFLKYFSRQCICQILLPTVQHVSQSFYEHYGDILSDMQLFQSLSKLVADTEMQRYNIIDNNCQTIVSRLIYYVQHNLKDLVLPIDLTHLLYYKPISINRLSSMSMQSLLPNDIPMQQAIRVTPLPSMSPRPSIYHPPSGRLDRMIHQAMSHFNEQGYSLFSRLSIQPLVAKKQLDYYGFYADEALNSFLAHQIKNSTLSNFDSLSLGSHFQELLQQISTHYGFTMDLPVNMHHDPYSLNEQNLSHSLAFLVFYLQNHLQKYRKTMLQGQKTAQKDTDRLDAEDHQGRQEVYSRYIEHRHQEKMKKLRMKVVLQHLNAHYMNSVRLKANMTGRPALRYIGHLLIKSPPS